jgi:hypothetical protein
MNTTGKIKLCLQQVVRCRGSLIVQTIGSQMAVTLWYPSLQVDTPEVVKSRFDSRRYPVMSGNVSESNGPSIHRSCKLFHKRCLQRGMVNFNAASVPWLRIDSARCILTSSFPLTTATVSALAAPLCFVCCSEWVWNRYGCFLWHRSLQNANWHLSVRKLTCSKRL